MRDILNFRVVVVRDVELRTRLSKYIFFYLVIFGPFRSFGFRKVPM